MTLAAPLTPDTLRTIRRNAGRVPPAAIAGALGWPVPQLERIARTNGIDLRIATKPEDDIPEQATAAGNTLHDPTKRSVNVSINLEPSDYDLIVAKSKEHNLKRATLLAALVRGGDEIRHVRRDDKARPQGDRAMTAERTILLDVEYPNAPRHRWGERFTNLENTPSGCPQSERKCLNPGCGIVECDGPP
jgi:hypothetical protein